MDGVAVRREGYAEGMAVRERHEGEPAASFWMSSSCELAIGVPSAGQTEWPDPTGPAKAKDPVEVGLSST